jgi:hypothetical protein
MKKTIFLLLMAIAVGVIAQDVYRLKKEKPGEDFENIYVKKVSDSDEQTSFIIWVHNDVRLHKHAHHT